MKKIILLVLFLAVLFLVLNFKKKPAALIIDYQGAIRIDIPQIATAHALDIDSMLDSVTYIHLEETKQSIISQNDQMIIGHQRIFILNKDQHKLFIFSSNGKYLLSIYANYLDNFSLANNIITVYNQKKGRLYNFDLSGKLKSTLAIGCNAMEIGRVNDSLHAFFTVGLDQNQRKKTPFELALVNNDGLIKSTAFSTTKNDWKTSYFPGERFYSTDTGLYYIPPFTSVIFKITGQRANATYQLTFGRYTLTSEAYETVNKVDDYHIFPYVFDVSLVWESSVYCFFKLSFKDQEGYVLFNKRSQEVRYGLGYLAGTRSNFNVAVPDATYGNRFYSSISASEYNDNQQNSKSGFGIMPDNQGRKVVSQINIKVRNPVIICYRLKEQE